VVAAGASNDKLAAVEAVKGIVAPE